jgi:hypothetical protein
MTSSEWTCRIVDPMAGALPVHRVVEVRLRLFDTLRDRWQ